MADGANGNGNGKGHSPEKRRKNGQFAGQPGPGRPKGAFSLSRLMREVLMEEGEEAARERIRKWLAHADEGRAPYMQEVLNRIDGKVPDRVHVSEDVIRLELFDPEDSTTAVAPEATRDRRIQE